MKPKEKRWFTTVEVARHFEMSASPAPSSNASKSGGWR